MKKLLVLFISCIFLISCTKTDIRIQGFVTTDNGAPIENAIVFIYKSEKIFEMKTDHTGYYVFENVPVGTWELTVSKEGYETQSEVFSISGGSSGNIYQKNFKLKIPLKPQ